eukprot:104782-Rhodomonas_salina.2
MAACCVSAPSTSAGRPCADLRSTYSAPYTRISTSAKAPSHHSTGASTSTGQHYHFRQHPSTM